MKLLKFRVTEFRSVLDSGWIEVENITALIGTNESGKTNILLPLWKLIFRMICQGINIMSIEIQSLCQHS